MRVRLFAGTREVVGAPRVEIDLAEGASAADAFRALARAHPGLARYEGHLLFALDGRYVGPEALLREGAELALMPPVSGGAGDVALAEGPILLDPLVDLLAREGAGAVVGFLGLVRVTSGEVSGARVVALRFEAHEELALAQMRELREAAISKFGLTDMLVRHRLGTLGLGEPIVAVVAAAPHRRAAFEAAMWAMDELKTRVPIWKQEVDADGATRWIRDVR